ncbi:MAG: UDP-N-acetylglucosamine 2-epimerase (non-hydrolyzing) [Desulfobacterales bacterium]|nr:UDP-N-acetylglucosamine 2-epimerase (non-hydrolyzing) [Desulfobacterales bacterium]
MKILSIIGARPQFIKAAVVSLAIEGHNSSVTSRLSLVTEIIVHTGQHYDQNMTHIFFEELEISRPRYHLRIGSGTHGAQTGRMLEAIEQVLLKERPDWVLVYGDTNSTLAGALAAAKLHIPVAHVEAGLRSFNRHMPEEVNRVLTDHASELLFAPSETAVSHLYREGVAEHRIHLVGDVMHDAARYYGARAEAKSGILQEMGLRTKDYILGTVHRADNTDDPARLWAIFKGLMHVSDEMPVVVPLHPRTRAALERDGLLEQVSKRIKLIEPVGYLDMLMLEKKARLIATDSGGVQKEAFYFRVPCVVLREETEWIELAESGFSVLAGADSSAIACALDTMKSSGSVRDVSLYGGGHTAQEIIAILKTAQATRT